MENITLGSSLKTFEQLMESNKVKELEAFLTKETFTKYVEDINGKPDKKNSKGSPDKK